jgi:hypothetical protein
MEILFFYNFFISCQYTVKKPQKWHSGAPIIGTPEVFIILMATAHCEIMAADYPKHQHNIVSISN